MLPTVEWKGDHVLMVDQRKLPAQELYLELRTTRDVARAIERMVIRGAPAIGIAAAMGLALGVVKSRATGSAALASEFYRLCDLMAATRPTAVNLFWAIKRMKRVFTEDGARGAGRQPRFASASSPKRRRSMTGMSTAAVPWDATARRCCRTTGRC